MRLLLKLQIFLSYCWNPFLAVYNVSGQKTYPKWTNHFNPRSILFTDAQRNAVIMSNIGIIAMFWVATYVCSVYGVAAVLKYYIFPWFEVTHWCKSSNYLLSYHDCSDSDEFQLIFLITQSSWSLTCTTLIQLFHTTAEKNGIFSVAQLPPLIDLS